MTIPVRKTPPEDEIDALPAAVRYVVEHGEMPRDPKLAGMTDAFRLLHPNRRQELQRLRRLFRRRQKEST
jgi:hypothetical protein